MIDLQHSQMCMHCIEIYHPLPKNKRIVLLINAKKNENAVRPLQRIV